MTATSSGAVKARVESLGLHLSCFRDQLPPGQRLPACVVREALAVVPDLDGDYGDPAADRTVTETVQLDLYEQSRSNDPAATTVESTSLADALQHGLHQTDLRVSGQSQRAMVWACQVTTRVRAPVSDKNLVRNSYTLTIRRQLP